MPPLVVSVVICIGVTYYTKVLQCSLQLKTNRERRQQKTTAERRVVERPCVEQTTDTWDKSFRFSCITLCGGAF